VEQYLTLALEEAYRAGQTPVTPDLIDSVLAKGLNDVEPTLARYGYNARAVADLLQRAACGSPGVLAGAAPCWAGAGDPPRAARRGHSIVKRPWLENVSPRLRILSPHLRVCASWVWT